MIQADSQKIQWKSFIGFGIFILLLAYIIEKELQLPPAVLLSAAVTGAFVLLMLSFVKPEVPLYVLAAYIPFNRILPGDFGGALTALNFTNLLCGICLIGLFVKKSKEGISWEKSQFDIPILLFAFLGCISLVRGSLEYGSWYIGQFIIPLKRWLTPMLLYFLTLNLVKDRKTLKTVVVIMMLAVTIVGLMAIKDYIDVGEASRIEKARIGGIAENPNMLSAFFCYYMFIISSFYLWNASKAKYWLLLIPFLICFRGIQVTFSRGGYLAFFAGIFALTFFRSKKLFTLSVIMFIFALVNPVLLPKGIVYRLFSTFRSTEEITDMQIREQGKELMQLPGDVYQGNEKLLEASSRARLEIWRGGLRMIADHPVWGTGYGTFSSIVHQYAPELRGRRVDAHNSYIIIGAEMGLPTLFVFLWIIFLVMAKTYWLYRSAKDPFHRSMALGFLAGLFALLVSNMFGSRLHSTEVSGYFWMLCGLVAYAISWELSHRTSLEKNVSTRGVSNPRRATKELATDQEIAAPKSLSARLDALDRFKHKRKE